MRPLPSKPLSGSLSTPIYTAFAGAQALWWPHAPAPSSPSGPPKVFILFVPGNPGLSSYYTQYLSCIYRSSQLRGQVEILALSHKGHAPLPQGASNATYGPNESQANAAARGEGTSLVDQIRQKIVAVDAIRAAYPDREKTKVVLLAHSVGAYISLEVLKARPNAVDGLQLLFPTISHISRTPNAKRLRYLLHPLLPSLVISIPIFILTLLPTFFVLFLIRFMTRQAHPAARATADLLLTPGATLNSLKMARDEMRLIQEIKPETLQAVKKFTSSSSPTKKSGSVRTYWSRGEEDGWAPSWLRTQVEEQLELRRYELPTTVGHRLSRARSFSVSQARQILGAAVAAAATRGSSSPSKDGKNGTVLAIDEDVLTTALNNAPPSPTRKRTQPFHLRSAKATRAIDGSIILEPPDNFTDTEPETSSLGAGLAMVLGEEGKSSADGASTGLVDVMRADETGAATRGAQKAEALITSTICDIGMPHAFCLNHGVEMARITSHWIKQDHM